MARRDSRWWYAGALCLAAAATAGASQAQEPALWTPASVLAMLAIGALAALALVFPLKLSPQAEASLASAPLFAGALLLPPFQAVLAGAAASIVADRYLRRRPIALVINLGVVGLSVALAAGVYQALAPFLTAPLGAPTSLLRALPAGLLLHLTNLLAVAGIVTLRKGPSFWKQWRKTWLLDTVQEGGTLVLGYLGALLVREAWWSVGLLLAPLVLAHWALRRSVEETRRNVELAKQLEERMVELRATQATLVETAKMASVGTLAAGVAHEINNPLFAISGRAELLLRQPERHLATPTARESVQVIFDMARRASTVVRGLLGYSRVEASREPTRLSEVIQAALDLVIREMTARGIELRKELGEVPPISGTPSLLQQVFVNLLVNARDATPSGGVVSVRCWYEEGWVKASVWDTGSGIPPEVQRRLFEPFMTTKPPGKGTGLGLFICHRIVTEHGGRIALQSQESAGTEALLEFPVPPEPGPGLERN